MLREIVIDTETTGLDPSNGDRLIELGCLEIVNRIPTGREFHRYLNPERDIHRDAVAVHGLTGDFLKDKPLFKDVADEFLAFIGEAPLVAHNASFDLGFINAELERAARPPLTLNRVVDTLVLARRRHPAGPNSLDALCKRYGIDLSQRTKHGALLELDAARQRLRRAAGRTPGHPGSWWPERAGDNRPPTCRRRPAASAAACPAPLAGGRASSRRLRQDAWASRPCGSAISPRRKLHSTRHPGSRRTCGGYPGSCGQRGSP